MLADVLQFKILLAAELPAEIRLTNIQRHPFQFSQLGEFGRSLWVFLLRDSPLANLLDDDVG